MCGCHSQVAFVGTTLDGAVVYGTEAGEALAVDNPNIAHIVAVFHNNPVDVAQGGELVTDSLDIGRITFQDDALYFALGTDAVEQRPMAVVGDTFVTVCRSGEEHHSLEVSDTAGPFSLVMRNHDVRAYNLEVGRSVGVVQSTDALAVDGAVGHGVTHFPQVGERVNMDRTVLGAAAYELYRRTACAGVIVCHWRREVQGTHHGHIATVDIHLQGPDAFEFVPFGV